MLSDSFTVTDCSGLGNGGFFSDFGGFMIAIVPFAIGYALWRIFVTNRTGPGGTAILGLDENAATYTELYGRRIPWRSLFLHALVGVVTFKVGVFAFETYRYVMDLLSAWVSN
jgi:hypothetical protein